MKNYYLVGIFFQVEGTSNFSASGWGDSPHHPIPPRPRPPPPSRENPAQRFNRFYVSEKCCFSFFLVFPILSELKLENFPCGQRKQVGKFQSLQV